MFQNEDPPCSRGNEDTQEMSRDVPDVVEKRDCFLICFVKDITCRDVRYYNNIKGSGKYSSDFVQNFAEKTTTEYRCVVQMHGSEHTRRFR